jgi:hypothetical protein
MSNLKLSISSGTLGVDDSLWNSLMIKVCEEVNQMEILEKKRTIGANSLVGLWVLDWSSTGSGVDGLLVVTEGRRWLVVGNHCNGLIRRQLLKLEVLGVLIKWVY